MKSLALTSLFTNVTFYINPGDRAGLIEPTGCGKSTLLRIIASNDSGLRIGYHPQSSMLVVDNYLPEGLQHRFEKSMHTAIKPGSGRFNPQEKAWTLGLLAHALPRVDPNPGLIGALVLQETEDATPH